MSYLRTLIVGGVLLGLSCGGGDGGNGNGQGITAAEARAKCQTFKTTLCTRIVQCGVQTTLPECNDALSVSIDCSKVVDIAPSFDTCISELQGFSCAVLDGGMNTPASCTMILLVPPSS